MTAPVLTPTSQGQLQLASAYRLEVNLAYDQDLAVQPSADWAVVYDIIDFSPAPPAWDKVDTTTYDNANPATGLVQKSQRKVAATRVVTGSRLRVKHSDDDDNAGWEKLANGSRLNKLVQVRWFNASDPDEMGEQAIADCTYTKNGGGPADRGVDAFSLELQELAQDVTNPMTATTLPNATTVAPTSGAAGTMVTVTGTGFNSVVPTTGVKFGTTNATLFVVDSPTQIRAIVPAGASTGSNPVLVTTAAGADTTPVAFSKS